jgi:DNA-binding transcriptional ArsR family regulator
MAQPTTVAASYARALADPIRLGIIAALAHRPRTLESLARQLDVSRQRVSVHARALQGMGMVRSTSDAPRTYELLREPIMEESWGQLPLPARRETIASVLTQIHASAAAATDAGGFDRPDIHLSRASLYLTEEQWCTAAEVLVETFGRLDALNDQGEPGPRTPATAAMMLFTGEHTDETDPPETPAPRFGEEEALQRAWDLVESLDAETIGPAPTRWERIGALAEELRLVARAAACLDSAEQPTAAE